MGLAWNPKSYIWNPKNNKNNKPTYVSKNNYFCVGAYCIYAINLTVANGLFQSEIQICKCYSASCFLIRPDSSSKHISNNIVYLYLFAIGEDNFHVLQTVKKWIQSYNIQTLQGYQARFLHQRWVRVTKIHVFREHL